MPSSRLTKTVSITGLFATLMAFAWIAPATAIEPRSEFRIDSITRIPEDEQSPPGMEAPLGRHPQVFQSLEAEASAAPGIQSGPLAPALAASFIGIGMEADDDGRIHTPPDTHAATGLDRIVEVTNGHVAIYNKSGGLIAGGDNGPGAVDLDAFCGQEGCFDPKVIYDQESDRFVAVVLEGFDSSDTWLHIMVSKTSSPANLTTDWDKYRHSAAATISSTAGSFDYPGLGVSPDAVVVTGNLFSDISLLLGTKIRVFDKAELYDGDTTATFVDIDTSLASGGFTIQPAHHLSNPPSGTFYMLQAWNETFLRVVALTGVPGSPDVNHDFTATSDQGFCPEAAIQLGTAKTVDTLCPRMMDAVYRDGSLWGIRTGTDSSGTRALVRWYEILTNGFPSSSPSLRQQGAIDGGADEHTFMPSISVDSCGNTAVTYTQSSSSRYPEMRYTVRQTGDALNTMQAPAVAKTSVSFHDDFTSNPERWGDYSSTVIDPSDGSFWITHEYVRVAATGGGDNSRWGTWHANFAVACDAVTPTPTATPTDSPDLVLDGGFEQGSPNPVWNEFSSNFGTPLCTLEPCGDGGGTGPHSGDWWSWFGGISEVVEEGSVDQDITIPAGLSNLSFWLEIPAAAGTGTDTFSVSIDGDIVFSATDLDAETYSTYRQVNVDVSEFGDCESHNLKFSSTTLGSDITNFFIDDVVLEVLEPTSCDLPTATPTNTSTPTDTPTPTETHTLTPEPSDTPTETHTPTPEPSATPTETHTPTPEPSDTPTETHTPTPEPSDAPTETHTPTPEPSDTPTETHTPTPEPSEISTQTNTPIPSPTETHTATIEPDSTPPNTDTPTPEPPATPTETHTPSIEPSATSTETPVPSATNTQAAATATSTPVPGDLNQDGGVNVLDVQLCVNVFLGTETDSGIVGRSDINGDERVNVLDVQLIVNIFLAD